MSLRSVVASPSRWSQRPRSRHFFRLTIPTREAAITKRRDCIARLLERLERNDSITLETLALFVRFWLTSLPAVPEQSSPAARAKCAERYDRFVEALGRRRSSGSTVLKEVSLDSNAAIPE